MSFSISPHRQSSTSSRSKQTNTPPLMMMSLLLLLGLILAPLGTMGDTMNILGLPATVSACASARLSIYYSPIPTIPLTLNLYIANSGVPQVTTSPTQTSPSSTTTSASSTISTSSTSTSSPITIPVFTSLIHSITTTTTTTSTAPTSTIGSVTTASVIRTTTTSIITSTTSTIQTGEVTTIGVVANTAVVIGVDNGFGYTSVPLIDDGRRRRRERRLEDDSISILSPSKFTNPSPAWQLRDLSLRATNSINTTIITSLIYPAGNTSITLPWPAINVPEGIYQIYAYTNGQDGNWISKNTTYLTVYTGQNTSCLSNLGVSGSSSGTSGSSDNTTGTKPNIGAIVGGVIAGIVVLALIIIGGFFYLRKRKRDQRRFRDFDTWVPPPVAGAGAGADGGVGGGRGEFGSLGMQEKKGWRNGKSGGVLGGGVGGGGVGLAGAGFLNGKRRGSSGGSGGLIKDVSGAGSGAGERPNAQSDSMGMHPLTRASSSLGEKDAVDPSSPFSSGGESSTDPIPPIVLARSGSGRREGDGGGLMMDPMMNRSSASFGIGDDDHLDGELRELAGVAALAARTPSSRPVSTFVDPQDYEKGAGMESSSSTPTIGNNTQNGGTNSSPKRRDPPSPPLRNAKIMEHARKASETLPNDMTQAPTSWLERGSSVIKRKPVPTLPGAYNTESIAPKRSPPLTEETSPSSGRTTTGQEISPHGSEYILGSPIMTVGNAQGSHAVGGTSRRMSHFLSVDRPLEVDA